jgi:hypothetical protein
VAAIARTTPLGAVFNARGGGYAWLVDAGKREDRGDTQSAGKDSARLAALLRDRSEVATGCLCIISRRFLCKDMFRQRQKSIHGLSSKQFVQGVKARPKASCPRLSEAQG